MDTRNLRDYKLWVSEQARKDVKVTYENYKKIKEFEDIGYFLETYIVEGADTTKDVLENNRVNITGAVASISNNMIRVDETHFVFNEASMTYTIVLLPEGVFTTDPQTGVPFVDYIPIATVTTDVNKVVTTIVDDRGQVGGFYLKGGIALPGYVTDQDLADELANYSDTTAMNTAITTGITNHKNESVPHKKLTEVDIVGFTPEEIPLGSNKTLNVTKTFNRVTVSGANNEITTINDTLGNGTIIYLSPLFTSNPIVIKHGVGNIFTPDAADITLNNSGSFLQLAKYGDSFWGVLNSSGVKLSGDQTINGVKTFTSTAVFGGNIPVIMNGTSSDVPNKRNFRFDINGKELRLQSINDAGAWVSDTFIWDFDANYFRLSNIGIFKGTGAPEGNVSAPIGSLYLRTDGSTTTTLYVKTSGGGNVGWTAK